MIEIEAEENQAEWIREIGDDEEKMWKQGEEVLEIKDYYRVWVKSPDNVPEEQTVLYDRDGGPAGNHYYYEVPFETTTQVSLNDTESLDRALKREMMQKSRKEYPERIDLVDISVPEKDLTLVDKAQEHIENNLPLFGSNLRKSNPAILRDAESAITLFHLYKILYDEGDRYSGFLNQIQKELGERGVYSFEKISKARRYIDTPEEAPDYADVQEGPKGGLYYETDGTDEPSMSGDGGDDGDIATQVQEATGADTDLSNFEPDEADKVGNAIIRASDRGWTERVEAIESSPPDFLEEGELDKAKKAFGFWDDNHKTLYFNPDKVNEDEVRDAGEQWLLTDPSVEGVIQHEIGHSRHYQERDGTSLPDDWEDVADQMEGIEDADMLKYIAFSRPDSIGGEPDGLSKLAQVSPMEFVAEAHAALSAGQEVDEGVLNLYTTLDGPEVETAMERSQKEKGDASDDSTEFPEWIQAEVELMRLLNRQNGN